MRKLGIVVAVLGAALAGGLALVYSGWLGASEGPGTPTPVARPAPPGARAPDARQILFGDLHVHTTFSADAFLQSLPLMGGSGAHPPADACDFARFCSGLDFWSINDHAEQLTPRHWAETREAIRQCNAVGGGGAPDVVAFLGWEWTQAGTTPANHYGHKNVVLREVGEGQVPTRPVHALTPQRVERETSGLQRLLPLLDFPDLRRSLDYVRMTDDAVATPLCPEGVPVRDLPADCREGVARPAELFAKLDEWGFDSLVIPHGNAWGIYTPPGSTWDKQLAPGQHDPRRQRLLEAYSGHGNSEPYRDWRAVVEKPDGELVCPGPSASYLPSCWRAGEIVRARCEAAGLDAAECGRREADARRAYLASGIAGHRAIPGVGFEEWLDSGQCRDCFQPAFNFRPGMSSQYALSVVNPAAEEGARRFRFGLIASSDTHTARPGTGYKEFGRYGMTDSYGVRPARVRNLVLGEGEPEPAAEPGDHLALPAARRFEVERHASFFYTGGLVATHAGGRSRDAIWDALERREVYGTSGERILLWFDLLGAAPGRDVPMGGEAIMSSVPRFRVRAAGAFEQRPGCPEFAERALGPERLAQLCLGECHHPSGTRKPISRIEVVRILPARHEGEPIRGAVDRIVDPWRVFECPPDPAGCSVEFEDPEFPALARDAVYYVRALEFPRPHVNAGNLRCTSGPSGECEAVEPCYADERVAEGDDCPAPAEPRAWSSPIFVDFGGEGPDRG